MKNVANTSSCTAFISYDWSFLTFYIKVMFPYWHIVQLSCGLPLGMGDPVTSAGTGFMCSFRDQLMVCVYPRSICPKYHTDPEVVCFSIECQVKLLQTHLTENSVSYYGAKMNPS